MLTWLHLTLTASCLQASIFVISSESSITRVRTLGWQSIMFNNVQCLLHLFHYLVIVQYSIRIEIKLKYNQGFYHGLCLKLNVGWGLTRLKSTPEDSWQTADRAKCWEDATSKHLLFYKSFFQIFTILVCKILQLSRIRIRTEGQIGSSCPVDARHSIISLFYG